jgi:hypothetical protein
MVLASTASYSYRLPRGRLYSSRRTIPARLPAARCLTELAFQKTRESMRPHPMSATFLGNPLCDCNRFRKDPQISLDSGRGFAVRTAAI